MTTTATAHPITDSILGEFLSGRSEDAVLVEHRQRALSILEGIGLPDPENEAWRKTKLGALPISEFGFPGESQIKVEGGDQPGVSLMDFAQALDAPGSRDAVLQSLEVAGIEPSTGFFLLHNLVTYNNAIVIHVTGDVTEPVFISHELAGGNVLSHRVVVIAESNARATIVERFQIPNEGEHALFSNAHVMLFVRDNAQLNHVSVRKYGAGVFHFHEFVSEQRRDSRLHASLVHDGGRLGRTHYVGRARDPGAEFRGIGVAIGRGSEFFENTMLVEHYADHTTSSLHYKTVMHDRSHSVFDGNLYIEPGTKHVDSHQTNNNILLSRQARAESMPRLVIRAEDVGCEHGATVGDLDSDALFFLMSRGIPEAHARQILIEGFLSGIVEEIPVASLREAILTSLEARLGFL